MQPIVPNLWFDLNADEAVAFYVSLFDDSRITATVPFGPDSNGPEGSSMVVEFELMGRPYTAINGGPQFPLTEAFSLEVPCDTQQEIDRLWAALVDGGEPGPCGWLKDRYGLSWQVVPAALIAMMHSDDKAAVARVTQTFMAVDGEPLTLAALEVAFAG